MNHYKIMIISSVAILQIATLAWAQRQTSPTAEDILKALKQSRPFNEVIPPVGLSSQDLQKSTRKLLPEGWTLVDRTGRLEQKDHWWYFVFEPALGDRPIKLLPNAKQEQMVRTVIHSKTDVIFSVSGEMTVFQGENYLLARMAMRPPETLNSAPVESTSADQNANEPPPAEVSIDASAEDVLSKMKNLKPTQSIVGFNEPRMFEDLKEATTGRSMIADGTPFIRRAGRLQEQGGWWMFSPESDHLDHPDFPLRLLPNKNTEMMVRTWSRDSIGLVFIVSGEITLYRSENYLLPRVAVRRIDSGNLRK